MSAGYKRYLYPIRRSCSCKKVGWNKIIIIKCNLNMQDDAYKRLAKQFNLSTPVWFCRSRFYRKKGHIVASKRAQLVRKSDSHSFFVIGKYKLHWPILWLNKTKASGVMQEQVSPCLNMLASNIFSCAMLWREFYWIGVILRSFRATPKLNEDYENGFQKDFY